MNTLKAPRTAVKTIVDKNPLGKAAKQRRQDKKAGKRNQAQQTEVQTKVEARKSALTEELTGFKAAETTLNQARQTANKASQRKPEEAPMVD